VNWLAGDPTGIGVDKYLIIGDLNSYDKEDPIEAIKAGPDGISGTDDDFVDLIYDILGEDAYSYVFDGQTGYLDYAMANMHLAPFVADVDVWHINADEPDILDYDTSFKSPAQDLIYAPDAFRASDHDPVIVTLTFNNAPYAVDDEYETNQDVTLVVPAPGVLENDVDLNENDIITAA
jgi:predicted extracellular nuclease